MKTANPNHVLGDIQLQHDASGQRHCWRHADEESTPLDIIEEIVCEACDAGQNGEWHEYIGSNGCFYRWK